MDTTRLETIEQVRAFLAEGCDVQSRTLQDDGERRRFVERTLRWFGYFRWRRSELGTCTQFWRRCAE